MRRPLPARRQPGPSPRRRLVRLFALGLLGVAVATGLAAAAARPASADPTPPPTPAVGVPDPGVRPSANPPTPPGGSSPAPSPNPTPSPIGPPPTTPPSPSAPATPAPQPGPPPPGWTPSDDGYGDPGLFDIPGQIRKAIAEFIVWVAKTGLKPVFDAMGTTVLSTPDLTGNPQVVAIWTTTLVVANGIFVLFIVAGGFIVASRDSLQTQYGFKEIAPRLVLGAVAANVSLIVVGKAIEATNALTAAIAGQGVDGPAAATALLGMLDQPLSGGAPNILLALLVLAVVVLAIVVVITFILRVALLILLVGAAPLALACHATPQTEGLAYGWWRAFAACLGWQLGQALIVLATLRVFLTRSGLTVFGPPNTASGLLGVLVCLSMLWLLVKLPGWIAHIVLGPLGRRHGRGLLGSLIHTYLTVKTLGAITGLSRASRSTPPRCTTPAPSTTRRPGDAHPEPAHATGSVAAPVPAPAAAVPSVRPPTAALAALALANVRAGRTGRVQPRPGTAGAAAPASRRQRSTGVQPRTRTSHTAYRARRRRGGEVLPPDHTAQPPDGAGGPRRAGEV